MALSRLNVFKDRVSSSIQRAIQNYYTKIREQDPNLLENLYKFNLYIDGHQLVFYDGPTQTQTGDNQIPLVDLKPFRLDQIENILNLLLRACQELGSFNLNLNDFLNFNLNLNKSQLLLDEINKLSDVLKIESSIEIRDFLPTSVSKCVFTDFVKQQQLEVDNEAIEQVPDDGPVIAPVVTTVKKKKKKTAIIPEPDEEAKLFEINLSNSAFIKKEKDLIEKEREKEIEKEAEGKLNETVILTLDPGPANLSGPTQLHDDPGTLHENNSTFNNITSPSSTVSSLTKTSALDDPRSLQLQELNLDQIEDLNQRDHRDDINDPEDTNSKALILDGPDESVSDGPNQLQSVLEEKTDAEFIEDTLNQLKELHFEAPFHLTYAFFDTHSEINRPDDKTLNLYALTVSCYNICKKSFDEIKKLYDEIMAEVRAITLCTQETVIDRDLIKHKMDGLKATYNCLNDKKTNFINSPALQYFKNDADDHLVNTMGLALNREFIVLQDVADKLKIFLNLIINNGLTDPKLIASLKKAMNKYSTHGNEEKRVKASYHFINQVRKIVIAHKDKNVQSSGPVTLQQQYLKQLRDTLDPDPYHRIKLFANSENREPIFPLVPIQTAVPRKPSFWKKYGGYVSGSLAIFGGATLIAAGCLVLPLSLILVPIGSVFVLFGASACFANKAISHRYDEEGPIMAPALTTLKKAASSSVKSPLPSISSSLNSSQAIPEHHKDPEQTNTNAKTMRRPTICSLARSKTISVRFHPSPKPPHSPPNDSSTGPSQHQGPNPHRINISRLPTRGFD